MKFELNIRDDESVNEDLEDRLWLDDIGGPRKLPEPLQEVPEKELWAFLTSFEPEYIESRKGIGGDCPERARILWFGSRAYAIIYVPSETGKGYMEISKVFRIGCVHYWKEMRSEEADRGEIFEACPKCGTTRKSCE